MTADEIISLVFEYEHAADGDSTVAEEAAEVNFKAAIHQVVNERDEALARLEAMTAERDAAVATLGDNEEWTS